MTDHVNCKISVLFIISQIILTKNNKKIGYYKAMRMLE